MNSWLRGWQSFLFHRVALFTLWFSGGFGIVGWWDIVDEVSLAFFGGEGFLRFFILG